MPQNIEFSKHPLVLKVFNNTLKSLIYKISKRFNNQRLDLLSHRQNQRAKRFIPQIDHESEASKSDWRVTDIPQRLLQRRVEITGPAHNPKIVIQMLNSNENGHSADAAMIDFEDSMMPSWDNVLNGYVNVMGAVKGDLKLIDKGRSYQIDNENVYPMIRIRGLHLDESNILVDDEVVSASLVDLITIAYHTHLLYEKRGIHLKFYIPKCESANEARFWNNVLRFIEDELSILRGEIKLSLLIETYPAAVSIEEILYEVRERCVALNVGRWDKIFSDIKTFAKSPDHILADRSHIGLNSSWMMFYAKRVIKICHKRGALAIGGMSAFTPGKTDEIRHEQQRKVREDKLIESQWGHDGCWVSHPFFISTAMACFSEPNQLDVSLEKFDEFHSIEPIGGGPYTYEGLKKNIKVGIAFLYNWKKGLGCIALDNLMEDLATLEISRIQVWQWLYHEVVLDNKKIVKHSYLNEVFSDVTSSLIDFYQDEYGVIKASEWFMELVTEEKFKEFLVTENEIYDEGGFNESDTRPTL